MRKAAKDLPVEVIVVDNNSVDGSVELVRRKFPEVQLIANQENTGFSVANNQGIRQSRGEYVLLLNPDTVVEEDTFRQIIDFMDAHPKGGALGVKMYDGKGNFLPESKRGLPSPLVAFYKMSGLGALFPQSKHFNYYYLGHLAENEVQEIEVLSGAFMLLRRSVLDKIGLLDETFFMYGEDIDLSYRVILEGYKNYYFPHTRIIHYKGESTKKGSLNYWRMFYNAMIIFARKHYSGRKANLYIIGIYLAIYFKAALSIFSGFVQRIAMPLLDASFLYTGMWLIKDFFEKNLKAAEHLTYPMEYMLVNVPLYIVIWLSTVFLSGGYDKPLRISKSVRGILLGTIIISAVYGFLPESYRFSRGMIVVGAVWAIFSLVGIRILRHFLQHRNLKFEGSHKKRAVIVGNETECKRVQSLLFQAGVPLDIIGYVQANSEEIASSEAHVSGTNLSFLGNLHQLREVVEIYRLEELIFCAKDLASQQIIQFMIDIGQSLDYKIVPQESLTIIGSNSKNTAGDLYTIDINLNLQKPHFLRNKRVVDLCLSIIFLVFSPILFFWVNDGIGLLKNCLKVLIGQLSWVGYADMPNSPAQHQLPPIRKGILSPLDSLSPSLSYDTSTIYRLNLLYARDYHTNTDLDIIWKGLQKLGRKIVDS